MAFAWSYSALNAFETCPRRYELTRLKKAVPDPPGEAALWGQRVHRALENYLKKKGAMDPEYASYLPIADAVARRPGKLLVEHRVALTREFRTTEYFGRDVWVRGVFDAALVDGERATILDWKGLPVDTPLPTPTGFTTMGEVHVGEELLGGDGQPCRVVGKSAVSVKPCYRIDFDDGTSVTCDDEHKWATQRGVLGVEELLVGDLVPVAGPARHAAKKLPLDPYVLGAWLAAGRENSSDISTPDAQIIARMERRGFPSRGGLASNGVLGLSQHLTPLGIRHHKRIPQEYLTSSIEQRTLLLQGLMDLRGTVDEPLARVEFTTPNHELSLDIARLLESLGQRVLRTSAVRVDNNARTEVHVLSWKPVEVIPFAGRGKRDTMRRWGLGAKLFRRVVAIVSVEPTETQCVAVDSADHLFLCTEHYIPTHNTGRRKADPAQLQLFAAMGFASFPFLKKIDTGFVWLKEAALDVDHFERDDSVDIWREFLVRVKRMEEAVAKSDFPPRPSGLCRNHCPVPRSMCEFSGRD